MLITWVRIRVGEVPMSTITVIIPVRSIGRVIKIM